MSKNPYTLENRNGVVKTLGEWLEEDKQPIIEEAAEELIEESEKELEIEPEKSIESEIEVKTRGRPKKR